MRSNTHTSWAVRSGTLVVWALAAASAAYWGLRLAGRAGGPAAPLPIVTPVTVDAQALARTLGAVTAPVAAALPQAAPLSSRFALVGVLAGAQGSSGAALIAVDGKPAKPYRVGAQVDEGLVLQSLSAHQAQLGAALQAPATVTLQVPKPR